MASLDVRDSEFCDGSARMVALDGDLDAYSAPRLLTLLIGMADGGVDRIVIDCTRLHYVDSSGLGALVAALKQMANKQGSLALAGPNGSVLRVLQITGLDRLFRVFGSVDDARDAVLLQPA